MRKWKQIGIASLFFFCMTLNSAAAEGWELGGGAGLGKEDAVVGELFIGYEFAPFASWGNWSLQPQARLTGMVWSNANDTLGAAFAGLGLALNMPGGDSWRPYVAVAVGGGLTTENTFDGRHLGGHFLFRDSVALGLRFGEDLRNKVEVVGSHYSNAGLYDDNQGFNSIELTYARSF